MAGSPIFLCAPGASVATDQALFSLVKDSTGWIDANVKETDLQRIRPGMPATVVIATMPLWDGDYMRNPSLFPFHAQTSCSDIVVIQINPIERLGAPRASQEIMSCVNEIGFDSSSLKELRAIDCVS